MAEIRDYNLIKDKEKKDREEIKERLNKLSGFLRLSPKQKQYILVSFYIQQRAERGTDTKSASRIGDMPDRFDRFSPGSKYMKCFDQALWEEKGSDKYQASQLAIMNTNCHQALEKLEEISSKESSPETNWIDMGPIGSYLDLEEQVKLMEETSTFPLAIQAWDTEKEGLKYPILSHSTLLLGRDESGELIVWEKSAFNMPFQLNSLRKLCSAYPLHTIWKMRPLITNDAR
jgi:hypothetical protein